MPLPRVFAGPRKRWMLRLLINGLGRAAAAFAIAWLMQRALAELRHGSAGPGEGSGLALGGLVLAGGAVAALRALERVDAERLGQDYVMKVRLRIFGRVARMPARGDRVERIGLTLTRLSNDLNSLKNWVSTGVARMTVASVSVGGILAALAWFDPLAALASTAVVLLCAASGRALTPRLRGSVREARRRRGRLAGNLGEKVLAFATVRHFGRTLRERRRLRRQSQQLSDALIRRMRLSGILRALPEAAFPVAVALLISLAGLEGVAGAIPLGDLAVTILLLGMLIASLRDLAQAWDFRLSYEEGRRRIERILASPRVREAKEPILLRGSGPLSVALRKLRLEGVFDEASAEARPGERVLVTGPTGAGKSTLLRLVARLFDPDAGRIFLDGQRLRSVSLDSLHEAVQLVSPDLPLLRGSVAENLAYGLAEASPRGVAAAAALCGLESGVLLPRGLDTRIRENGENLPDGLRGRISLARAIAAGPRLLLVDDPVFQVDAEARAALQRALASTPATVLLVGREGDDLLAPDRIWRLGDGRIEVKRGSGGPAPQRGGGAGRKASGG